MRVKYLFISLITFLITLPCYSQDYKSPESAAFDFSSNRYFITNFTSGEIIQIDQNGTKSVLISGLTKPLGTILLENVLYLVENGNKVRGFNIKDGSSVMDLKIDGAIFLNDLTTDSSGVLYTTDSRCKSIYKVNISENKYSILLKTEYAGPNGILYDSYKNRLIVCYFTTNSAIQEIHLKDTSVTTLVSNLENLDGITMDRNGNIYVSAWGPGSFAEGFKNKGFLYKFNRELSGTPEIIPVNNYGPADIYFNKRTNQLVIPYFLDNIVEFITVK